ncbi:hypothetical protein HMPREF0658_1030 [Hoylesella marshii DSM 16973 = JCM 13450]|uniref:Uncharacterized protein n=1 Tax=Hoylesella marshii DSM 16973 = JCM 13450 TaxID=862515 RepID=E0NS79_9BACT|nr:hypothetical protein HMPREF0658_1030 [Hoylesella marshii DSM 16973 = JCM 13450]
MRRFKIKHLVQKPPKFLSQSSINVCFDACLGWAFDFPFGLAFAHVEHLTFLSVWRLHACGISMSPGGAADFRQGWSNEQNP